jgi:hypothetical protein
MACAVIVTDLIQLYVSSIIELMIMCAIQNENASPVTAVPVDKYLKLVRNH